MRAIAMTRIFGPNDSTTPAGHPITICSAAFDPKKLSPEQAIANAALRRCGIEPNLDDWKLEYVADVKLAANDPLRGTLKWSALYQFEYLPERQKWKERGLNADNAPDPMKRAWYLKIREGGAE